MRGRGRKKFKGKSVNPTLMKNNTSQEDFGNNNLKFDIKPKTYGQKEYLEAIDSHVITFCSGPAGCGKAQPLDSTIWTPNGPVLMGDIKVGDEVLTPDGGRAKIKSLHPQGEKDVYLITFLDGETVECCEDHLWNLYQGNDDVYQTIPLKNIINSYKTPKGRRKYYVDNVKSVDFNEQDIGLDPYLLGCLIGDGGFTGSMLSFTNGDKELIETLRIKLKELDCEFSTIKNEIYTYNIKGAYKKLKPILKNMHLDNKKSYDKFIPKNYLYNSTEVRIAILQGLLDTDGSVSGCIEFSTSSDKLAEDVKTLVQSLGGIARTVSRMGRYKKNNKYIETVKNYRIYIRFNNDINPFKLSRKKNKVNVRTKYFMKRYIDNIEKLSQKECQCIKIDSKDELYLTDNFIPTHNTILSSYKACQSLVNNEVDKIIITRPAINAGEDYGFLPKGIDSKMGPYLIPVMENFQKFLGPNRLKYYQDQNKIEICPVGFMRGRDFANSFILVEECQNLNQEQLKMILTRLQDDSKMVLSGDYQQNDLNPGGNTDFEKVCNILSDMDEVSYVELSSEDIIRAKFISKILTKFKEIE